MIKFTYQLQHGASETQEISFTIPPQKFGDKITIEGTEVWNNIHTPEIPITASVTVGGWQSTHFTLANDAVHAAQIAKDHAALLGVSLIDGSVAQV